MPHAKSHQIFTLSGWPERLLALLLRGFLYLTVRLIFGPPWPVRVIRLGLRLIAYTTPGVGGVAITQTTLAGVAVETITPTAQHSEAVWLYLHGGGFIAGSPFTHRALTTRLAAQTGARVFVPDYRLAPEHPYPAGLDDCVACYRALLDQGIAPSRIVVAGDSAGGGLTVALALRARRLGLPLPAGLMCISPVAGIAGVATPTASALRYAHSDPLIRPGLVSLINDAYQMPSQMPSLLTPAHDHALTQHDLAGLPPMLIQVGELEMLYDDAVGLAEHAARCGVAVELEDYRGLWHVLHLVAAFLPTARLAVSQMTQRFTHWTNPQPNAERQDPPASH
jgi:acetyl esterase/lipase